MPLTNEVSKVYAQLDGVQKCWVLDAAEAEFAGVVPAWGQALGLSDEGSTALNAFGHEVAVLCTVWIDTRREVRDGYIADIKAAAALLTDVNPEATRLANDPKGMDYGEVSDYGCTVVHGIDDALKVLHRAIEV